MSTNRTKPMGQTEWLLLVALSLLWGGSFFFEVAALNDLPPFIVILGRAGLAAIGLILLVRATGRRMPRSPRVWGAFLVMAALNNLVPFSLIVWGQTRLAGGMGSIGPGLAAIDGRPLAVPRRATGRDRSAPSPQPGNATLEEAKA